MQESLVRRIKFSKCKVFLCLNAIKFNLCSHHLHRSSTVWRKIEVLFYCDLSLVVTGFLLGAIFYHTINLVEEKS